jgi:hypothetical protein
LATDSPFPSVSLVSGRCSHGTDTQQDEAPRPYFGKRGTKNGTFRRYSSKGTP